jgi:hypothetical protein
LSYLTDLIIYVNIFVTKLGLWCCALFDGFDIKLFA